MSMQSKDFVALVALAVSACRLRVPAWVNRLRSAEHQQYIQSPDTAAKA